MILESLTTEELQELFNRAISTLYTAQREVDDIKKVLIKRYEKEGD
jgi:hypothetical protein